jgi:hypothetical protein
MAQKQKTVGFTKEKDTKNTVRFTEDAVQGEPPIIGTLYVHKPNIQRNQMSAKPLRLLRPFRQHHGTAAVRPCRAAARSQTPAQGPCQRVSSLE